MTFSTAFLVAAIALAGTTSHYAPRDQVNEALALADGMKTAVAEHVATKGSFPTDNAAAGLPDAALIRGRFVTRSTVRDAQMEFEFGGDSDPSLQGKHLLVIGKLLEGGNGVEWTCQSNELPASACPSSCACSG